MPRKEPQGWYPDEIALAGPEHLDPDFVAGYDRKAGDAASLDAAALPRLGLSPGATVVDVGAGTGTFTNAAKPGRGLSRVDRRKVRQISPLAIQSRSEPRDTGSNPPFRHR